MKTPYRGFLLCLVSACSDGTAADFPSEVDASREDGCAIPDAPGDCTPAKLEAFANGVALAPGGGIIASAGALQVGEEGLVAELRFINAGSDDLEITGVGVASEPPGVFRLAGDPDGGALLGMPFVVKPQNARDGVRSALVYLFIKRPTAGIVPHGTIRVLSNSVSSTGEQQPVIEYSVFLQGTGPAIQVIPREVDFGTVQQGTSSLESVNILNPGAGTLLIDRFTLSGHPNFRLIIGSAQYQVSAESASSGIVLTEPVAVEPGTIVPVSVGYSADDGGEARGQVVFFSNDPAAAAGTTVGLQANVGGPCIKVDPRKVAFGGRLIGTLASIEVWVTSCGDQALEITEIGLTPDSSSLYSLSLAALPGVTGDPADLGPADAPVVVQPNQEALITVRYFPEAVSPIDANNQPVYDTGTLRIHSNSSQAELLTEVSAFGVQRDCPTAAIIVREGEEVIPQTRLSLIGSMSTSATGEIATYQWEVDQPGGSQSLFFPSATAADPSFEVNVAGRYVFRLTVTDSLGEPSCVPAEYEVFVNPDEAIHIELLWNTPNDPDQIDADLGADLDLHFTHPSAAGGYDGDGDGAEDGWFDVPFDCFWLNNSPNWGSLDPTVDDNPSLDRDDTDGVGPENLNLNIPENGATYQVGVNYYDDDGFGTSYATVRIYIYGNLAFEVADVELHELDMWTVTSISWPTTDRQPQLTRVCGGTTTPCVSSADCSAAPCGLRITPNYQIP